MTFIKKTLFRSALVLLIFSAVLLVTMIFKESLQDLVLDPSSDCLISTEHIKAGELQLRYSTYTNRKVETDKALLLLPPTGGKNIIDKGYAAYFCKAGYKVYIMENWTGLNEYSEDLKIHERYQNRFQKSVALTLSLIEEEKIGVLGASAGAINFSVTLGIPKVVQKVQAFVGIVSGGPLCKVIAQTREKALKKVREVRMKNLNIKTIEEYEAAICSNLSWKAAEKKPEHLKLGLISATKDITVLSEHQEFQIEKLNPDFLRRIDSGHIGAIIRSFLFYKKSIKTFFDESLG